MNMDKYGRNTSVTSRNISVSLNSMDSFQVATNQMTSKDSFRAERNRCINLKTLLRTSMPDNFVSKVYFASADSANFQRLFNFFCLFQVQILFIPTAPEVNPNVNLEQSPLSFLPCSQFPSFNSFRHVFIINVACWEYHQIKYNHSRNIQWEMIHYLVIYKPNNHEELNKIRVPNHHNNPNAINGDIIIFA